MCPSCCDKNWSNSKNIFAKVYSKCQNAKSTLKIGKMATFLQLWSHWLLLPFVLSLDVVVVACVCNLRQFRQIYGSKAALKIKVNIFKTILGNVTAQSSFFLFFFFPFFPFFSFPLTIRIQISVEMKTRE